MAQTILNVLMETSATYLTALKAFLPRALATLSIVIAGWLIAFVLRLAVRRMLGLLRFNQLARRFGAAEVFQKADLPAPDALVASLVFWLVFIGFLLSGVGVLGFRGIDALVSQFVLFVPRLLVAIVILVVGFVAANFAWRAALLAAVNARMPSARLAAGLVRFLIVVLAVAMALEQIAVAKTVVLTAFAIAFGAVMLAVAIAFGIGGGPIARRILEQQFPERRDADPDGSAHL
jgi:hypothetical protein